jgi:hypothetical protein
MKVISLLQPWAQLVVLGLKLKETRSRNTKYRGQFLVHASKGRLTKEMEKNMKYMCFFHAREYYDQYFDDFDKLPYGAIIGKSSIVGTGPTEKVFPSPPTINASDQDKREYAFGDYGPDRFAYNLGSPSIFNKPILAKGSVILPWEFKFEGNDESFINQCTECCYAACSDRFPIDKMNIDTDAEEWDQWCPKCESRSIECILENLPFYV